MVHSTEDSSFLDVSREIGLVIARVADDDINIAGMFR